MNNKEKVLIVDNSQDVVSYLAGLLYESYQVFCAKNRIECLKFLREEKIKLAVFEIYMENLNGTNLLRQLKEENIQTSMIAMTSQGTMELGETMLKEGAVSVIDKPIKKDVFLAKVKRYIPPQYGWKIWLESFLEDNYANPDLNFAELRRYFRFSKSHGCVLFKKHLNKTFREALRDIRVKKATALLREDPFLRISEIACRCGFRSVSRLNEAFYRLYGVSPSFYRRKWTH